MPLRFYNLLQHIQVLEEFTIQKGEHRTCIHIEPNASGNTHDKVVPISESRGLVGNDDFLLVMFSLFNICTLLSLITP